MAPGRSSFSVFFNFSALVIVHPEVKNWIKYARFEEKHGYIAHSRKVYERAVEFFGEEHMNENLFVAFARFEETQKEVSAARSVFRSKGALKDLLMTFSFLHSLNESGSFINTLWTESPNIRRRSSLRTTPCSRRSLGTVEVSRMSLSANGGSSTKKK